MPNTVEAKVVDGNSDGLPDQWQGNVASFLSANNNGYLTLAAPQMSSLREVTPMTSGECGQVPLGISFPVELVRFIVKCPAAGMAQTLTLYLPKGTSVTGFMNYGPTAGDMDPRFYSFMLSDGLGAVIGPKTITLYLQDGGWGDNDLSQDGKIELTCGPSRPVVPTHKRDPGEVLFPVESLDKNTTSVEEWMNYE